MKSKIHAVIGIILGLIGMAWIGSLFFGEFSVFNLFVVLIISSVHFLLGTWWLNRATEIALEELKKKNDNDKC